VTYDPRDGIYIGAVVLCQFRPSDGKVSFSISLMTANLFFAFGTVGIAVLCAMLIWLVGWMLLAARGRRRQKDVDSVESHFHNSQIELRSK
jgi:high-affinity Fe2+/Pb2+ permease